VGEGRKVTVSQRTRQSWGSDSKEPLRRNIAKKRKRKRREGTTHQVGCEENASDKGGITWELLCFENSARRIEASRITPGGEPKKQRRKEGKGPEGTNHLINV